MKEKYKVIIFVILTLFFTGVIFFVDTFFLSEKLKNNLEEKNIEQSLFENDENIDKNSSIEYIEIVKKIIKEKALKEKKDDSELHRKILELKKNNSHYKGDENIVKKINFAFIPKNFEKKQEQEKIYIWKTLHSDVFILFWKI